VSGLASTDDDIIDVGAPLPRIETAEALDGRRMRVEWRGGGTVTVDLAPVFQSRRVFIPLRDNDALFRSVAVNEDGNALEWPDGSELSAFWIATLPPMGMSNTEFRELMAGMGLTLDGMASALEISRRQVADYRKAKPIPNHIAFATRYLADRQTRC
jgi:hypothetical protein